MPGHHSGQFDRRIDAVDYDILFLQGDEAIVTACEFWIRQRKFCAENRWPDRKCLFMDGH